MQTRRSFHTAIISGLGSVIGIALGVPTALYLLVTRGSKSKGNFVEAANLTQLQVGKPQEVTFERTRVDGWRTFQEKVIAWVVRTDDKNVVAYGPQCTHLGCVVHFQREENRWHCPCHEGNFDALTGAVLAGPPTRPLGRIDVEIRDDGIVWALGRSV